MNLYKGYVSVINQGLNLTFCISFSLANINDLNKFNEWNLNNYSK